MQAALFHLLHPQDTSKQPGAISLQPGAIHPALHRGPSRPAERPASSRSCLAPLQRTSRPASAARAGASISARHRGRSTGLTTWSPEIREDSAASLGGVALSGRHRRRSYDASSPNAGARSVGGHVCSARTGTTWHSGLVSRPTESPVSSQYSASLRR